MVITLNEVEAKALIKAINIFKNCSSLKRLPILKRNQNILSKEEHQKNIMEVLEAVKEMTEIISPSA